MGIPSVTTNLSGFGCFMQEHIADPKSYGIYIVDRRFIGLESSIQQLAQFMYDFSKMNRRQRIIMRNRTERLSDLLDWKNLGIVSLIFIEVYKKLTSSSFQYYRHARVKALQIVYTDYIDEIGESVYSRTSNFNYPRPMSAPPSPSSSRHTTPAPSLHGSDDEDSVDEDQELHELGLNN